MEYSSLCKTIAEDETSLFLFRLCLEADHIISGIPFTNKFKDPIKEQRFVEWKERTWKGAEERSKSKRDYNPFEGD